MKTTKPTGKLEETMVILNGTLGRHATIVKLSKAIRENCEDVAVWSWLSQRNITQLHAVWVRSGYSCDLEPVILSHVPEGITSTMKNLELGTREMGVGSILQYDREGGTGYPVGIFKTSEQAGKYSGGGAGSIEFRWNSRCEGHIGGTGETYNVRKGDHQVTLISQCAVADYLGCRITYLRSVVNTARIQPDRTASIGKFQITVVTSK